MPFLLPPGFVAWWVRVGHGGSAWVTSAFHEVARHTGIPVFVVAAAALVLTVRLARKGARLVLEMTVATALVLGATKLGWIHW